MTGYIPGQHLAVSRLLYTHHGIYAGDGLVLHYTAEGIVCCDLETFADGWKISVIHHPGTDLDRALDRAYSRLGEQKYHLLFNNCESFCNWCHTGVGISFQVINMIKTILKG